MPRSCDQQFSGALRSCLWSAVAARRAGQGRAALRGADMCAASYVLARHVWDRGRLFFFTGTGPARHGAGNARFETRYVRVPGARRES